MKLRIKQIRTKMGLKQKFLVETTGLSNAYISSLETGNIKKSPSMEVLTKISDALGVRIGDLFNDAKPIAVAGKVGAGAKVPLFDAYAKGDGLYHVACPADLPFDTSIVAVEVEGDSMIPLYNDGDVLFYSRDVLGVPNSAIGRICICEDANGDIWVKYLKGGSEKGKFNLISTNPLIDNMLDVQLSWAAPVKIVLPAEYVEQIFL